MQALWEACWEVTLPKQALRSSPAVDQEASLLNGIDMGLAGDECDVKARLGKVAPEHTSQSACTRNDCPHNPSILVGQ